MTDTTSGDIDIQQVLAEVSRLREKLCVKKRKFLRYLLSLPSRTFQAGASKPDMLYDLHSALLTAMFGMAIVIFPQQSFVETEIWGIVIACVGINRWLACLSGNFEWHRVSCLISAMSWGVFSAFFFTHDQLRVGLLFSAFVPFSVLRYLQIVRGRHDGRFR